jgi:hypothetical protein
MNMQELTKHERKMAEIIHNDLTTKHGVSYENCLKIAMKIYDEVLVVMVK